MKRENARKPKLVFFRCEYLEGVTSFQLVHRAEHLKCLEHFFDVTVVSHDCDYRAVCDTIQPSLALFETGLEIHDVRRPKISGARADNAIPKLALLNSDGCSELRPAIMSDVEALGVDALFSISLVAMEHLEGVADRLFVWPNFVDPGVFRNYEQPKVVPLLFTGSLSQRYPWRNAVHRRLLGRVPALWCPHLGYRGELAGPMPVGEAYARLINVAKVVPACGSVSNELVRKHLEIPAAMTCLVTERTPALESAGFIDLVNCIMATPADVLEKVTHVLSDDSLLVNITSSGHRLVHSRHTVYHRDQILQWYKLNTLRRGRQEIRQPDPFGQLTIEEPGVPRRYPPASGGRHLAECRKADAWLQKGRLADAERAYLDCLALLVEFPEAKVGMARCRLRMGDPLGALQWIVQPLRTSLVRYGAEQPDPVEWALFILTLIAAGRLRSAMRRARQFPQLRHLELDRVRWLVSLLYLRQPCGACPTDSSPINSSIHRVPSIESANWIEECAALLRGSGRYQLANLLLGEQLRCRQASQGRFLADSIAGAVASNTRRDVSLNGFLRITGLDPSRATLTRLDHPLLRHALGWRAQHVWDGLVGRLTRVATPPGSVPTTLAFQRVCEEFLSRPGVDSALLIASRSRTGDAASACLLQRTLAGKIVQVDLLDCDIPTSLEACSDCLANNYDVILVDGNSIRKIGDRCRGRLAEACRRARFAAVGGLNEPSALALFEELSGMPKWGNTVLEKMADVGVAIYGNDCGTSQQSHVVSKALVGHTVGLQAWGQTATDAR